MFAHLQSLSLLDYPGKVAAVVWTVGCNLRCPFCYNAELVLPEMGEDLPRVLPEEAFALLRNRVGFLDGVVVTGGEPTLHIGLPAFLRGVKELGFLVKLDTNGTRPDVLRSLLEDGLVDYVALDVKAPFARYTEYSGCPPHLSPLPPGGEGAGEALSHPGERERQGCGLDHLSSILRRPRERKQAGTKFVDSLTSWPVSDVVARVRESVAIVRDAPDCELRTTVAPGLAREDLIAIAGEIRGARRYILQSFFVPEGKRLVDETWRGRPALSSDTLRALLPELQKLISTALRG